MESLLNSVLPHWPGVMFRQRADLTFEFAVGRLEELTGRSREQWEREAGLFWGLVHELDREEFRRQLARVGGTENGLEHSFRIRHATTGRVRHISEFRRAVRAGDGAVLGYEGFWLEVTRQTLAERRLAGAAWQETLGLLTLGLAHDFNNLLAGILGLSDTLLAQLPPAHPFQEGLALMKRSTRQAAQLIQRIAQLHQAKSGTRAYHNLNDVVRESSELLSKVLPKRVELVRELETEPLPLYVDAMELQQVLIQLCLNGADAMPERGTLTLRTSRHTELPPFDHGVGLRPRTPAACLSVTDTGTGIKPRLLPFLFDPFFTTKPMNRGSGLGLYHARLFVEKHQGAITVDSEEGAGTTFRVWLPQADFTEAERALEQSRQRPRGLLLAGPPGGLLDSTAEFLRQHRYHVVLGGADAEDVLRSSDDALDGALLMCEPGDTQAAALARFVRLQKLPLKIFVRPVGCQPDELPAALAAQADLILPQDLAEDAILERLAKVFDGQVP